MCVYVLYVYIYMCDICVIWHIYMMYMCEYMCMCDIYVCVYMNMQVCTYRHPHRRHWKVSCSLSLHGISLDYDVMSMLCQKQRWTSLCLCTKSGEQKKKRWPAADGCEFCGVLIMSQKISIKMKENESCDIEFLFQYFFFSFFKLFPHISRCHSNFCLNWQTEWSELNSGKELWSQLLSVWESEMAYKSGHFCAHLFNLCRLAWSSLECWGGSFISSFQLSVWNIFLHPLSLKH